MRDRERQSVWDEEKLQEVRRWLRAQELHPIIIAALATITAALAATIIGHFR